MARIRRITGRRKIEIKKISNESNLQVTFSKRRYGVFKKASELCTLCAAEVAIFIFSPSSKVFSFGHPSINDVVDRFLTGAPPKATCATQIIEAHRNANRHNLNAQLTQFSTQLDMQKKSSVELNKLLKPSQQFWWAVPIQDMGKPELELLKSTMEGLERVINLQANTIRMEGLSPPMFFAGSSSGPSAAQPLIQPLVVPVNRIFDGNMIAPPPANHDSSNMGGSGLGFY